MNVLVTGAGGFAGQHLVRALLARGDSVVGTTLDGRKPEAVTLNGREIAAVNWRALDITDARSVSDAHAGYRFDEVYHLAGQSSVGGSFADPLGTWDVNATGTLRLLLELSRDVAHRCRVLVVSSAEVYGDVPSAEQPVLEERAAAPVTPYGSSKLGAEAVALQAAATGPLEVVVARSFNHAGPGQDERFIFPSMARQLAEIGPADAERVLKVGNLEARRDFLDVRDVAGAYQRLLESGENGGVYNVCSGESHSLQELVEDLVRISGSEAQIQVDPERFRAVDIPELRGSPQRLSALGWSPRIDLHRTLEDLYAEAAERARIARVTSG